MSRANKAPNDYETAKEYIRKLSRYSMVKEIWLQGSRSPLRSKQAKDHSDWDFGIIVVDGIEKPMIVQPRVTGELHADISLLKKREQLHGKAVQLHPIDTHDVFAI